MAEDPFPLGSGDQPMVEASLPDELAAALAARSRQATDESLVARVWQGDETLWGGPGVPEIGDRLGWLRISAAMPEQVENLKSLLAECRADGLTEAVLLGMGGSSLGPEVIRRSFGGGGEEGLRMRMLDSTDPGAVLTVERDLDPERTLFIVSSKSGGTIETLSHFRYFHAKLAERLGEAAGSRFVAVTDPGSPLAELSAEHGFRRTFANDPEIGGRYSVMSYFGLVPAALMGVDLTALLRSSRAAEEACARDASGDENPGLSLGLLMGELALRGRDKLTFLVSEPVSSFGLWVEQLIAESTGKHGRGIVPVADEPRASPEAYGDDRVFVYLRNAAAPSADLDATVRALADDGQPTATLNFGDATDLGGLFFLAEFATAVAGSVLGINPFDQPNVQEAKDNTNKMLERYAAEGELPEVPDAGDAELRALLDVGPPGYVALMGYLEPSDEFDRAVGALRTTIRDRTGAATTFGYGPRFLHSTGQLHKGGPATGRFLQLIHNGGEDVEIPGAPYTFGTLKGAQAAGDLETLRAHGLPAERLFLQGDSAQALEELNARLEDLL